MNEKNSRLSRRSFLLGVGAGGAAGAAVIMGQGGKAAPGQPTAEARPRAKGYQETAHVQKYYRTTQV